MENGPFNLAFSYENKINSRDVQSISKGDLVFVTTMDGSEFEILDKLRQDLFIFLYNLGIFGISNMDEVRDIIQWRIEVGTNLHQVILGT